MSLCQVIVGSRTSGEVVYEIDTTCDRHVDEYGCPQHSEHPCVCGHPRIGHHLCTTNLPSSCRHVGGGSSEYGQCPCPVYRPEGRP